MLSEIIIIITSVVLISQYGSERMFRHYERKENEYPIESITPLKQSFAINEIKTKKNRIIDLNEISLNDLRRLDKIYNGTEIGNEIYKIRKEKVIVLRNESRRKFGLIDKINSIDINKMSLEKLERMVRIMGE